MNLSAWETFSLGLALGAVAVAVVAAQWRSERRLAVCNDADEALTSAAIQRAVYVGRKSLPVNPKFLPNVRVVDFAQKEVAS